MTTKQSIIARILELCEALKTAGDVKEVVRETTPFALAESNLPSLQVIVGPEDNITDEEELRGYVVEFDVMLKLTVRHASELYNAVDVLVGRLQAAIEGDIQLNGLATKIVYQGDNPFSNEINKPLGGNMVTYRVQYRRRRAQPETSY